MSVRLFSVGVLVALGALWAASGTQREKSVVDSSRTDALRLLETEASKSPQDGAKSRALAQAYIEAKTPGLAVALLERTPQPVRSDPETEHLYARALVDHGRAADALAAEGRVLAACEAQATAGKPCPSFLVASALRRKAVLAELVQLGIDDANANPEKSSFASQNATRQVRLAPQAP